MAVRPSSQSPAASATPALVPQGQHTGKPSMPMGRVFTMVGSRHRAHLHLLSQSVSKAHAILVNDMGSLYIRDTASREHVFVNEKAVKEAELRNGDLIKIGTFNFRFQDASGKSGRGPVHRASEAVLEFEPGKLPALFDGRTLVIGRRPTCDVVMKEIAVSNVHAVIFEYNGQHHIRDLGSRTGTYVNGEQIHQQVLKFGDQLRIGDHELRFLPARADEDIDELEHLIGTATLGDESIELASEDAARINERRIGDAAKPVLPTPQPARAAREADRIPLAEPEHALPLKPRVPLVAKRPAPPTPPVIPAGDLAELDLAADFDLAGPGDTQALAPEPSAHPSEAPAISAQVADDHGDEVGVESEERQLLIGGDLHDNNPDATGIFEPIAHQEVPIATAPPPPDFDDLGLELLPEEIDAQWGQAPPAAAPHFAGVGPEHIPLAPIPLEGEGPAAGVMEQPAQLTTHPAFTADLIAESSDDAPPAVSEPHTAGVEHDLASTASSESVQGGQEEPAQLATHLDSTPDSIAEHFPASELPAETVAVVDAEPDAIAERAALFVESAALLDALPDLAAPADLTSFFETEAALPMAPAAPPPGSELSPDIAAEVTGPADDESHAMAERAALLAEPAANADELTATNSPAETAGPADDESHAMAELAALFAEPTATSDAMTVPIVPAETTRTADDKLLAMAEQAVLFAEPAASPDVVTAPTIHAESTVRVDDELHAMAEQASRVSEPTANPDVITAPIMPAETAGPADDELHAMAEQAALFSEPTANPDVITAPIMPAETAGLSDDELHAMAEQAALFSEPTANPDVIAAPIMPAANAAPAEIHEPRASIDAASHDFDPAPVRHDERLQTGEFSALADGPSHDEVRPTFEWDVPLGGEVPPPFPAGLHPMIADGAVGLPRVVDNLAATSENFKPVFDLQREPAPVADDAAADTLLPEVIGATEPTPESAQHLAAHVQEPLLDEFTSDAHAEPSSAVDAMSDSQFNRAMQDFAGSALGSLVEHAAEEGPAALSSDPTLPRDPAPSIEAEHHAVDASPSDSTGDSLPSFEDILAGQASLEPTGDDMVDQALAFLEHERNPAHRDPEPNIAPSEAAPTFPRSAEAGTSDALPQDLNVTVPAALTSAAPDELAAEAISPAPEVEVPPNFAAWLAAAHAGFAPAETESSTVTPQNPVDGAVDELALSAENSPGDADHADAPQWQPVDVGPAMERWTAEDSGEPAFHGAGPGLEAASPAESNGEEEYGLEFEEPTLAEAFAPVSADVAGLRPASAPVEATGGYEAAASLEAADLFSPDETATQPPSFDFDAPPAPTFELAATAAEGLIPADEPAQEVSPTPAPPPIPENDTAFALVGDEAPVPAQNDSALAEPQPLSADLDDFQIDPESEHAPQEFAWPTEDAADDLTIEPAWPTEAEEIPASEFAPGQVEFNASESTPLADPVSESVSAEPETLETVGVGAAAPETSLFEPEPAPLEPEGFGAISGEMEAIDTVAAEPAATEPTTHEPAAIAPAMNEPPATESFAGYVPSAAVAAGSGGAIAESPAQAGNAPAVPGPAASEDRSSPVERQQAAPPPQAQRMNPMLGMSRDFGSFLGGIPLVLPTAPVRRPRPLFGETPVSDMLKQSSGQAPMVISTQSPGSRPPSPPPSANAALAAPAAAAGPPGRPSPTSASWGVPAAVAAPRQIAPAPLPPTPQAVTAPAGVVASTFTTQQHPAASETASMAMPPAAHAISANAGVVLPPPAPAPTALPSIASHQEIAHAEPPSALESTPQPAPTEEVIDEEQPKMFDSAPEALDSMTEALHPISDITEAVGEQPAAPKSSPAARGAANRTTGSASPVSPAPASTPLARSARKAASADADTSAAPGTESAKPRRPLPPPPARSTARRSSNGAGPGSGNGAGTGLGQAHAPAQPIVDVFSQHPVDQDDSFAEPEIPPTGYVPPAAIARRNRPPGNRPPMQRKPAEPMPGERKPATRKPAVVESLNAEESDIAEQMEDTSPLEGEAPGPVEGAEHGKKRKKRWRFPFFGMSMLVIAAGGLMAGAWFALPPRPHVSAALRFQGLESLTLPQRGEFIRGQQASLSAEDFRKRARQIYESDLHGRPGYGFLYRQDDATQSFASIVEGAHADGDRFVLAQRNSRDPEGDRLQLRAVMTALYAVDRRLNETASARSAQVATGAERLATLQRKIADLEDARRAEKDLADRSAALEKASSNAEAAMQARRSELETAKAAAANPQQSIEDDLKLKEMTARLKPLNATLGAARAVPNGDIATAAAALDAALTQFQLQLDTAKIATNEGSGLSAYLSAGRAAQTVIRQAGADLAQRRKLSQQTVAALKRALMEKHAAQLKEVKDEMLQKLAQDLDIKQRQLNTAVSANLAGAAQIRGEVETLTKAIDARRQQLAAQMKDTPEMTAMKKLIDEQTGADQRIDEQFNLLAAAAPKAGDLPPDQQQLLAGLDEKWSAVKAAREQVSQIAMSGVRPDMKALQSQVTALQAQIDARRGELTAAQAATATVPDSTALALKQAALETAQQLRSRALSDWNTCKTELAAAHAKLEQLRSNPVPDDKEIAKLQRELDAMKSQQPQAASLVLPPQDPQHPELAQVTAGRNDRPWVLASLGVLFAFGAGWLLIRSRRATDAQSPTIDRDHPRHARPSLRRRAAAAA